MVDEQLIKELDRTRDELLAARRWHDEDVGRKLDKLENGQTEIKDTLAKLATLARLEKLEVKVAWHDKVIYIGIGGVLLLKFLLEPLLAHFVK